MPQPKLDNGGCISYIPKHLDKLAFRKAKWNWTEAFLLTTALLMTILSNCMIANDSHWGHSAARRT